MQHRPTSSLLAGAAALGLAGPPLAPFALAAGEHADAPGNTAEIGQPGTASEATRTVEVTMYDNYFEPESLEVGQGETVRFVVTNEGGLVHEFNIATAEMHTAHQERMTMMVEHGVIDGDHINRDMMKMDMGGGQTMEHDDPNSVLLEPGQTAELVWTFTTAADLEFACNVPGHYEAGMVGEIDIQG